MGPTVDAAGLVKRLPRVAAAPLVLFDAITVEEALTVLPLGEVLGDKLKLPRKRLLAANCMCNVLFITTVEPIGR